MPPPLFAALAVKVQLFTFAMAFLNAVFKPPPSLVAVFESNWQLVKVVTLLLLCAPPPSWALLPVKVQSDTVAVLSLMQIPPPSSAAMLFRNKHCSKDDVL